MHGQVNEEKENKQKRIIEEREREGERWGRRNCGAKKPKQTNKNKNKQNRGNDRKQDKQIQQ